MRVAVAIVRRGEQVLVQRRLRRTGFVHEFPMGKAETGEELPAAALRELFEETGLKATLTVEAPVHATTPDGHLVAYVFLEVSPDQHPRQVEPGRQQTFLWITMAELAVAPFLSEFMPGDQAFIKTRI